MHFTAAQWRSKVIYQALLLSFDGHRLTSPASRICALKKAIRHFRSHYPDFKVTTSDVIIAARKLWVPTSRVEREWYHITNTARRAVIGCSFYRVIYGGDYRITSWCNAYPITKRSAEDINENTQEWLKRLALDS